MKRIVVILLALVSIETFSQESIKIEKQKLVLPSPIVFRTGTTDLTPESEETLQDVLNYLTEKHYISLLRIESHTDNMLKPDEGQMLSERRALTVARWLVAHGVDCDRLVAVGFGDARPIASNTTRAGRFMNNRINFCLAGVRGKIVPGLPVDGGGKRVGELCQ
jgi:OmpA-OmpF porin, OOP family